MTKIAEQLPEEIEPTYDCYFNDKGEIIKGIKVHSTSGELHLYGLLHQKRVLVPGSYKPKGNKQDLTVEKDKIRKLCPVNKFRQFRILPEQLEKISVCGMELLPTMI